MTVDELILLLRAYSEAGKGHYVVIRDGYADDLEADMIGCDDGKGELWL